MTTAIEYALMAGASYISNRDPENRFPIPDGWVKVMNPDSHARDLNSGFEAISFTNGSDIVISYAGTDGDGGGILSNPDKQADAALGAGLWSEQLAQAADYYLQIKALNPSAHISFTGHSLGGGLAALMAVLFGESAFTFDQAPFKAALIQAQNLKSDLIHREANMDAALLARLLAPLDHYITAAAPDNFYPVTADTLAARQTLVTNLNVQGEFLSSFPWNIPNRIGTQSADIANSNNGVSADDLHSQALLTTFLQSNQTAAQGKTLNDVTFKLPDLLKMIFDTNLFAYSTATSNSQNENLLEHLIKHETGVTGSIPADAMVTRLTADLWKLAQDGGMTLTDQNPNPALNELSKALTAFAMQFYYEQNTVNTADKTKQLFTDLSTAHEGTNGIRFAITDVSQAVATAMDSPDPSVKVDLTAAKGYQYLQAYLAQPSLFTPAEHTLIQTLLPTLRDWYVQAGSSGMNATDTQNRGAFMLGGSQADALVGGTANDLLVGNAGDDVLQGGGGSDVLMGGKGNDSYVYTTGNGLDLVLDSDGLGSVVMDGAAANDASQLTWRIAA